MENLVNTLRLLIQVMIERFSALGELFGNVFVISMVTNLETQ